MRKKHTNSDLFEKKYSDEELKEHIKKEVDNEQFNRHCQETADNLSVDVSIVKDVLLNNSFVVLSLIQKSVLKNKEVKINITGFFSFIVVLIKYKYTHLRKFTKGKTY